MWVCHRTLYRDIFWFTNKVDRHLYQERLEGTKTYNCCWILCVCVCFQWQPEAVSCTSWLQKWVWWMSCIRLLCDNSWDFLTFPWLGENNLTFVLLWAWNNLFSKHGIYPEIQFKFMSTFYWLQQVTCANCCDLFRLLASTGGHTVALVLF